MSVHGRQATGTRRLARLAYSFSFLDDFVPWYPLYAVFFVSNGLSTSDISVLLIIWTLVTLVCEVPSGGLADRFSRRSLLVAGAVLRTTGFAIWVLVPTFAGFATGFVLWGIKTSLTSGTWQALLYDELKVLGSTERYTSVSGRSSAAQAAAIAASSLLASPLMAIGGFAAVGWASVLLGALTVPLALLMPETPRSRAGGSLGYLPLLRAGVREASGRNGLWRLTVLASMLTGVAVIDEYLPLQAIATGIGDSHVPLVMLVPWLAMIVGGVLAARAPRLSPEHAALVGAVGAALLGAGALIAHPIGFLGIACFYAAQRWLSVIVDARLQSAISGPARASVTSVASFGTQVVALTTFGLLGLGGLALSVPTLLGAVALAVLLLSPAIRAWLPPAGVPEPSAAAARPDRGDPRPGEMTE